MFRREAPLDPDVIRDLDALDAVLGGDHDADPVLTVLAQDVDAARPRMDAAARDRLEARMQAAIVADRGATADPSDAAALDDPAADRAAGRGRARGPGTATSPRSDRTPDRGGAGPVPDPDGPARDAVDGPPAGIWSPRVASGGGGGGGGRSLRDRLFGGGGAWRPALVTIALAAIVVPIAITASGGGQDDVHSVAADREISGTVARDAPAASSGSSAGASGGTADDSATSDDVAPESSSSGRLEREVAPSTSAPDVRPSPTTTTDEPPTLGRDRQVVRDVDQTVRVGSDKVADATTRITQVVQDAGGYLGASQVQERGDGPYARFEIVVPTDRLDQTVGRLSRIGELVRLDRRSTDVTSRSVSLADQIADLRAERDALRRQLARTTNEDRRRARQRELRLLTNRIAGLQAQQRSLRGQTQTSRIALSVVTGEDDEAAPLPGPDDDSWGLDDALDDAGRVLEVIGGAAIIAGVVIVPVGGLLLIGWVVVRRRRRRIADELVDEA
ncbi:MAG: DUF4349 domain-containing protein [Solirubrobacteraceae bacterium]